MARWFDLTNHPQVDAVIKQLESLPDPCTLSRLVNVLGDNEYRVMPLGSQANDHTTWGIGYEKNRGPELALGQRISYRYLLDIRFELVGGEWYFAAATIRRTDEGLLNDGAKIWSNE